METLEKEASMQMRGCAETYHRFTDLLFFFALVPCDAEYIFWINSPLCFPKTVALINDKVAEVDK